jgi:general secretion pathway protein G
MPDIDMDGPEVQKAGERMVINIIQYLRFFGHEPKLTYVKSIPRAKKDLAKPKMALIESAIERFSLDCGQYPDDSMGLDALLIAPAGLEEKWNGPYLKESQLLDPWGNPYIYVADSEINPGSFDLVSLGADGVEGGEGDNEDIFNE